MSFVGHLSCSFPLIDDIIVQDLPDIDDMMASPDWPHRGGAMNFVSGTKRLGALSIIHEEIGESPVATVVSTILFPCILL